MADILNAGERHSMEIKDKPFHHPPAGGGVDGEKDKPFRFSPTDGEAAGGTEKTAQSLLKQRINNFLIIYFNYLTLALALAILAAGLFLFIYPQYQEIAKGNETAEKNLQAEHEIKRIYLNGIRDLKNLYQLISAADREKIAKMVPAGNQAVSLIPEIESIVLKNGAVLNSIKIAEDPKSQSKTKSKIALGEKLEMPAGIFEQLPEGVGLTKIEINLSSVNYPVLKNLLKNFENNLWLLDIAQVDYDAKENKVILIIYSYYLL